MKNISFKRNESVLRGMEIREEQKKKRPRNWDRIIYFFVFFTALFFIGRYLFNSWFYIEADGHVLFDNVDIRNIDDSRILQYYVEEGTEVKIGDTLFSYSPDEDQKNINVSAGYESTVKKQSDVSWAEREVFAARQEMELNRVQIEQKRKMRSVYEQKLNRVRNEVMLDVLPASALDDLNAKIAQLNYEIETLVGENQILKANMSQLNAMKRDLNAVAWSRGTGKGAQNNQSQLRYFLSPLTGTITHISKNAFEVALRDEIILSIHRPENVYVKAFFKQKDLAYLKENDIVIIEFPDGTSGRGIVKRFYSATYRLPEEFQKKYEPVTRSLSADILPTSPEDFKKWRAYWKLGVKIKKFKY